MKFIARGTKYGLDEEKLTFAEARAVERACGMTFDKLRDQGGVTAMQAMVWVAMKREQPTLRFTDLDDMEFGEFEQLGDEPEQVEPDPTATRAVATLTRNLDEAGVFDDDRGGPSTTTPPAT